MLCSGNAAIDDFVFGEAVAGADFAACAAGRAAGSALPVAAAGQFPGWKHPTPFTVTAEPVVRSGTMPAVAAAAYEQPMSRPMDGPPITHDPRLGY